MTIKHAQRPTMIAHSVPMRNDAAEENREPITQAPPSRIVVLEDRKFLAGTGLLEVYAAQYLVDKYVIAACLANGVKFHDVSDKPMPSRILIRRTQTIPAPRGGTVSVKVGEVVSDPWRVMIVANGGGCFDDVSGGDVA
jgi:hypothetical protein